MRIILVALLFLSGTTERVHAEGWACTIDQSVGFALKEKTDKWVVSTFKDSPKYVIKKTEQLDADLHRFNSALPHEWAVYDHLNSSPLAYCGLNKTQHFVCDEPVPEYDALGPLFAIRFDPKSLRFM